MALTLKKNDTPTVFNKDMVLGALIGSFIPIPGVGTLAGAAIAVGGGAIIGGLLGEKRMEREATQGKEVGEPSFWNKDTLIGGLIGAVAGSPILGAVAGLAAAALAIGVGVAAPAALAIGGAAAITGAVAAPIIGGYIGGGMGQTRMANELQEARQQAVVNDISKSQGPQVAQAVEYAMANDKTKNWVQHIENERALGQAQGHQHGGK